MFKKLLLGLRVRYLPSVDQSNADIDGMTVLCREQSKKDLTAAIRAPGLSDLRT